MMDFNARTGSRNGGANVALKSRSCPNEINPEALPGSCWKPLRRLLLPLRVQRVVRAAPAPRPEGSQQKLQGLSVRFQVPNRS